MSTKSLEDAVIQVAGEIVIAFLARTTIPADQLAPLVRDVRAALTADFIAGAAATPSNDDDRRVDTMAAPPTLPVAIEETIAPDHLICLEDGKPYRSLKRLLKGRYGLSPADYRAKWGLPTDYPMVAPNLAAKRSNLAKTMGLGGRPGARSRRNP